MKLLFSEYDPDYSRYLYPYVVWALPGPEDTPADLYAAGFHPASPQLDRFTLCRHLRVALAEFRCSSENRRILRKGDGIEARWIPRAEFECGEAIRDRWLAFAEARFGAGVMPRARLDGLMAGRVITHVLEYRDGARGGAPVGWVLMYLEPPRMAHYYYAFYDLEHPNRSLGLFLMTSAVERFREAGFGHLYLGTCYSERALYKAQFEGLEYFDGTAWVRDLATLKFLVRRDARRRHLLQEPEFLAARGGFEALAARTGFPVIPGPPPAAGNGRIPA